MRPKHEVLLNGGPLDGKKVMITIGVKGLRVPVMGGSVMYRPTDQRVEGRQVWILCDDAPSR